MRKSILINEFKKHTYRMDYCFFYSKKFKGICVSFDCDVPQAYDKTLFVFTFKFVFFTFWITFDELKKSKGKLIIGDKSFDVSGVIFNPAESRF